MGLGWDDGVPPPAHDAPVTWPTHPPETVRCHPWPEQNGLSANVWEKTEWVKPWLD
jgi:alpha-1,3-mannosyltransferase